MYGYGTAISNITTTSLFRERRLIEFRHFRQLPGIDPANFDVRKVIIFAAYRRARQASHHRQLSDMGQCIRKRTLEKPAGGRV